MQRAWSRSAPTGSSSFNRFNQPDFDLETLDVVTRPLISRDGDGEALRLPLRWIAMLFGGLPLISPLQVVYTGRRMP